MVVHRGETRREGERPQPAEAGTAPAAEAKQVPVEEMLSEDVDLHKTPAGFGSEVSTSTQSFQLIDEYSVPAGSLAEVVEVSVSIESNGQAKISLPDVTFGPFSGAGDFVVPLENSLLTPGSRIRVLHQSTDGTSTTTQAQVVVLEV